MRHVLDGSSVRTKAAMLDALAKVLDFPDYFGHNYDALADLVNDLPPGQHVLVWQKPEVLKYSDPEAYEQILDILSTADRLTLELD